MNDPVRTVLFRGSAAEDDSNRSVFPRNKNLWKPAVYTTILFSADLVLLIATGMADDRPRFENFRKAFQYGPALDDDLWIHNYLLHPLMGSETYLRARENGFSAFESFLFSTAASFAWEFLFESWTERPSTQDLLVTSPTGSVLGEIRYQLKKRMNKKYHWLVDPIDSLMLSLKRGKNNEIAFGLHLQL